MNEFSEECLITFLRNQEQLFPEPVAETVEEAEAFFKGQKSVSDVANVIQSRVQVYVNENR